MQPPFSTPPTDIRPAALRDSGFSRFLFSSPAMAPVWLILRLVIGWTWLTSSAMKLGDPTWVGGQAGVAVTKFLQGSLKKTGGNMPDVQGWYASFIQSVALPHAALFSYLVSFGELAVGAALILGFLTGIAAFFGLLMNVFYLWAGTLSTNTTLVVAGLLLVLAWRVAGWWGLDRFVLPRFWGLRVPEDAQIVPDPHMNSGQGAARRMDGPRSPEP